MKKIVIIQDTTGVYYKRSKLAVLKYREVGFIQNATDFKTEKAAEKFIMGTQFQYPVQIKTMFI